jgi:hypothetical protein
MKPESLYSHADWKYHKNRLGYDDLIDAKGRLVATVSVMDIAGSEMLQESYLEGGGPKQIFIHESDGCWSIYLAVPWLTPANVRLAIQSLGKLLGRTFLFDPYRLPAKLEARYRQQDRAMRQASKRATPLDAILPVSARTAAKGKQRRAPTDKRLAALLSHKLKA